ncbi:MAG: response regulator [Candidatus Delongbacteria bacterium]|nr:response regulator [Candidatus Delongbacteria bacterium]
MMNNKKTVNVLLVEDNEGDVVLAREAFRRVSSDINIIHIYDGEDVFDYLNSKIITLPDLIILDLNLPGVSGLEILQFIKTTEKIKDIPVVVFTTSNNLNDISKCSELKAESYVIKPIDLMEYFDVVSKMNKSWLQNK